MLDLPSQTKLKSRQYGQGTADELASRDFKAELEEKEVRTDYAECSLHHVLHVRERHDHDSLSMGCGFIVSLSRPLSSFSSSPRPPSSSIYIT